MRSFRVLLAALATVVLCAIAAPSRASFGTNFTDQWWNPNESGWGAAVLQQYDTLFVDIFVYGADGKPVWYTASAVLQAQTGRTLFTGDLYVTSGPWFAGFFNPAAVAKRLVGTLQFDAGSVDTATLTYSVDGLFVTKSIQRQLWTYEDFSGSYYGGLIYDQTSCANSANNGHVEQLGSFQISHAVDNSFSLSLQSTLGNCAVAGNYSQLGHMGTVQANYSCGGGINGTMTLYELERTGTGMTGRFVASSNACDASGSLGGVQR